MLPAIPPGPLSGAAPASPSKQDEALRAAAQALEANFLSEMLKSAGLGETSSVMGGGIGEEQFGSYLRQEQAKMMAESGGIGLAEQLFEAMKARAAAPETESAPKGMSQ